MHDAPESKGTTAKSALLTQQSRSQSTYGWMASDLLTTSRKRMVHPNFGDVFAVDLGMLYFNQLTGHRNSSITVIAIRV